MDPEIIRKVWGKGKVISGNDPGEWRKDECGAWIGWDYYGNRNSQYGWEIDHIKPESMNGTGDISNLRPLQWENNLSKRDGRLVCVVTANGKENSKLS